MSCINCPRGWLVKKKCVFLRSNLVEQPLNNRIRRCFMCLYWSLNGMRIARNQNCHSYSNGN